MDSPKPILSSQQACARIFALACLSAQLLGCRDREKDDCVAAFPGVKEFGASFDFGIVGETDAEVKTNAAKLRETAKRMKVAVSGHGTKAAEAMPVPMLKERLAKAKVPAKPMAAVMSALPRRDR